MLARLYKYITIIITPILVMLIYARRKRGKEDSKRYTERCGITSKSRPSGKLIWFHGASVGESQSILIVIDRLKELFPKTHILVTTGTKTSAQLMTKRLPKEVTHQYIPVDQYYWVDKFLDHWKPDGAIWVESEIWPNILNGIKKRQIPAVLMNARMSEKSYQTWSKFSGTIKTLLNTFDLCLAQSKLDAKHLKSLGAENVFVSGNVKYAAAPLPYKGENLEILKDHIQERPVLLWASTHANEEDLALNVHETIKDDHELKELLTIIVPRHPERGTEIESIVEKSNLKYARRSQKQHISTSTDIYLADTLGELGLFYKFTDVVFVGNSLTTTPGGGHNPIEPAQLDCCIIYGPHMFNFAEIHQEMSRAKASIQIRTPEELAVIAKNLLKDKEKSDIYALRAKNFALEKSNCLNDVMAKLIPFLNNIMNEGETS